MMTDTYPEENITTTRTIIDKQTGETNVSLDVTPQQVGQRLELFITNIVYEEAFSDLAIQTLATIIAEALLAGRHRNISILVNSEQKAIHSFFIHLDQTVGMHYHRTTGDCYVTPDYEQAYSPYQLSVSSSSFYLLHCVPVPLRNLSSQLVIQLQIERLAKWLLTGEQAVN